MSTITPPAELPAEDRELDERYRRLLRQYDGRAVRYKRWMLALWGMSMIVTWVPPWLAIPALAGWLSKEFAVAILRGAALTIAMVTIGQLVFLFRNRWLKYRAATERLRENCMSLRARLNVFGSDEAFQHFHTALDELEKEIGDRRPFRLLDHMPWSYVIGFTRLPEKLRNPIDHAPDKGLYPRCDDPETAETIVIVERLRSQQRWHLLKARSYSRRYLALQVGIFLVGLAGWSFPRLFRLDPLAPLTLHSMAWLFLIACRERLGYAQQCVRYTRIVETLEQIECEYNQLTARGAGSAAQRLEWLRRTADRVERALASEFQYWYFGRENLGSVTSR